MNELEAVESYLKDPDFHDAYAINQMQHGEIVSTYRPCYASIVCKTIRGKLRVYLHLTVEGLSFSKRTNDGIIKHPYGNGIVGCDIGNYVAYLRKIEDLPFTNRYIRCGVLEISLLQKQRMQRNCRNGQIRKIRWTRMEGQNERNALDVQSRTAVQDIFKLK